MRKILLIIALFTVIGCSIDDELDDCGCVKTTYVVLAINNHLVNQIESVESVVCQDEGSEDLNGNRYFTIRCE